MCERRLPVRFERWGEHVRRCTLFIWPERPRKVSATVGPFATRRRVWWLVRHEELCCGAPELEHCLRCIDCSLRVSMRWTDVPAPQSDTCRETRGGRCAAPCCLPGLPTASPVSRRSPQPRRPTPTPPATTECCQTAECGPGIRARSVECYEVISGTVARNQTRLGACAVAPVGISSCN